MRVVGRTGRGDMDSLTEWTMNQLPVNGAPFLVLISFLGSLGIPFPISVVIVGAGAFSRLGWLDPRTCLPACVTGACLADHCEFLLGRLAQTWLRRRLGQKRAWMKAQSTFQAQGGWAILFTRFWLTPLAPAVNMIAGGRSRYVNFLALDLLGQFIWVGLYAGLGWVFASQWKVVSQALGTVTAVSVAALLAGLAFYIFFQYRKAHRRSVS